MAGSIQYRVKTEIANLREEPSSAARIKAKVNQGAIVHVGERDGDWYRVQVVNGWMHKSVIEPIEKPS